MVGIIRVNVYVKMLNTRAVYMATHHTHVYGILRRVTAREYTMVISFTSEDVYYVYAIATR